ncbi:unnamed protein product [Danaus chrysippus]|uniref:(African queen) hypothetical protein n=1 Tax=Danaus chrysippus TaxID=151541 RepID=A0A8J2R2H8_9NEOP|nr:unnamed protein product [Danaus chrysippus]
MTVAPVAPVAAVALRNLFAVICLLKDTVWPRHIGSSSDICHYRCYVSSPPPFGSQACAGGRGSVNSGAYLRRVRGKLGEHAAMLAVAICCILVLLLVFIILIIVVGQNMEVKGGL